MSIDKLVQYSPITNLSDDVKNETSLRSLCPDDINELKKLCSEWFPVEWDFLFLFKTLFKQRGFIFYFIVIRILGIMTSHQVSDFFRWPQFIVVK